MRIAFIVPKLVNQGPILVVKDLIDKIKNRVELIDVFYFDDEIVDDFEFNVNAFKIDFFDKINFDKYDIVHSHMFRPDFYIWFHRKKNDTKTIFVSTIHQYIYDNLKGNYNYFIATIFEKIWLYFLKKQDIIVSLTDVMKEYYLSRCNLNFFTIYNGRNIKVKLNDIADNKDISRLNLLKTKYKLIGSHCLLTKRKGIHQIIKSLVILKDYALVIIGEGKEENNLKKIANNLGVINRCLFLGYRPNPIVYLNKFDVYVMSSYSEGFGLSLLEAGLNKLPVVCSDLPIYRELFTEKDVCFFELDNISSLSNAIELSISRKEFFSNTIFHTINEKYSVEKMAESYFKLYYDNIYKRS
jgi:glycosyltransferase involved in cell wall biosynthesis